jgi:type VI secretion system secreted protein Hcp
MAVDIFMKIDDIKGEAIDGTHADEISVLSWSWGVQQTGTTHSGPGGGAGKAQVHDLTFIHYVDAATPNLIKMSCAGKHFKNALLTVRKAGTTPLEYLKIKLHDVIITSVNHDGAGAEDQHTEKVTLNFGKFEVHYTPQKADGSGGATIPGTWNIQKNQESLA